MKHPHPSPTTSSLRSSVFEALAERIRSHEGPLFPLHVGDTWMEPHSAAMAESQTTDRHPRLHTYAPPHGMPELLTQLSQRLTERGGFDRRTEEIQVVAGATGGLSVACQTVLDPGDEVLIPAPFWPLIPGIVSSRGAIPVQVPFFTELDGTAATVQRLLEEARSDSTTAIYVNLPNNPTGEVLNEEEREAIASFAETYNLWILCDEAYEDLWFESAPAPFWARGEVRDRTLATHTFSKGYGLAGARIGYVHGPSGIMAKLRAVFTHQAYCAAKPMQLAALAALREAGGWVENARRTYREAAELCAEALDVSAPTSGTFLFFPLDRWIEEGCDPLPFFEKCLDVGVLLTPGAVSGAAYERWARLCFTSVSPDRLSEALDRLAEALGL